jgi:DNA-binding NarL/FixJ family response regulator
VRNVTRVDVTRTLKAIPIGIIEPQRLFAPFLTQLLSEAGFSVVTTLESMALDEIGRHEPTVVFVDVDFLDVDPIAAIRQLRSVVPNATICAYTGNVDEGWAAACGRAGANCIISKSAMPPEIVAGIQRALRLGVYVDRRFDNETDPERRGA